MIRVLFFIAVIIVPAMVSWWLFIPLALLYVYLVKSPYEIILAGFLFDAVYYFGESLLLRFPLFTFSLLLVLLVLFLDKKVYWQKKF